MRKVVYACVSVPQVKMRQVEVKTPLNYARLISIKVSLPLDGQRRKEEEKEEGVALGVWKSLTAGREPKPSRGPEV